MKKRERFKRGLFETLGRRGGVTSPPLMKNLDIPIKKTLSSVLGLPTIPVLLIISESIFFQTNKFIDVKEVAKALLLFYPVIPIHPFPSKKHSKTK